MKIQILSDLHNEFTNNINKRGKLVFDDAVRAENVDFDEEYVLRKPIVDRTGWYWDGEMISRTDADLIVLAGDINVGTRGVEWAMVESEALGKPIVYVLGNHEFYKQANPLLLDKVKTLTKDTNVHILENDEFIYNDVRFLGCTLWTNFSLVENNQSLAMLMTQQLINDYRKIRMSPSFKKIEPKDVLKWHTQSVEWLAKRLNDNYAGKTVVVTHMAPSAKSLRGKLDQYSASYASHLDELITMNDICYWLHGHTHVCNDYEINSTRIISNPKGYTGEALVDGFDKKKIITL